MLQLISIHINKTAGTSFKEMLRANYKNVFCINTHNGPSGTRLGRSCNGDQLHKEIPTNTDVIHGHFKASEVNHFNIPMVTWVRDPVNRVISNYNYELQNRRTEMGLLDYAKQKHNRNKMVKIISGVSIYKFMFIGITERFDKDIEKLSAKLRWKNCKLFKLNEIKYDSVHQNDRIAILNLNLQDYELYIKILELRGYDKTY